MAPTERPLAELPQPICSDVPGTWAYDTMSSRIRTTILAKIPRENDLSDDALDGLRLLDDELKNAGATKLRYIRQDGGPDIDTWNKEILPQYVEGGRSWLSAPWALAEFYFYRRVLEAISYFDTREDPFTLQKELGLSSALESILPLSARVNTAFAKGEWSELDFQAAVTTALWGNRMDLSIWPVGESDSDGKSNARRTEALESAAVAEATKMVLASDIDELTSYVADSRPLKRVDIVVDNAGFELFCDLCLADYLVTSGCAKTVVVQLKAHPTFVSDAMAKDVEYTVQFLTTLAADQDVRDAAELGKRWRTHIDSGRWKLVEDFFWVQPMPFWEMPLKLRNELASESSLAFIKGDANYRRLLGDLQWDYTTSFSDVASYFPTAVCALRTFKAEIACGLDTQAIDSARKEDPQWLVSGRYGVVQFLNP